MDPDSFNSSLSLRFRLLPGPVRLEPLRVLESTSACWNDWQLTFCILGASHAVCLEREDVCLTELLTCLPPPACPIPLLEIPIENGSELCCESETLRYRARAERFQLAEGDQLTLASGAARLERVFQDKSEAQPAWTRLGWLMEEDILLIESIHTYPQEGLGVRSHSSFQLKEIR